MNSDQVTRALLESAISYLEAELQKADSGDRARIQQRIEAITKLLQELFPGPVHVNRSREELEELFDKLLKKVHPED